MKLKLSMTMLLAVAACGGSSKPAKPSAKQADKPDVVAQEDEGQDEDGDTTIKRKKPKKGSAEQGSADKGSSKKGWGSGKSRTCLDASRLPDGAPSWIAGAFENDALRVCREAQTEDGDPTRACIGMDPETGRAAKVGKKPLPAAAALPVGSLKTEGDKPQACTSDGTCRPLGKKATKAITAALATEGTTVTVTADASLLAVSGARDAWSVAKDKPVKLKAPRTAVAPPVFLAAGKHLFAQWKTCAEGCPVARLFDAKGKALGDELKTADVPHAADDQRWTVLAGDLHVFDLATGKRQRVIELFPDAPQYRIDGTTYLFNGAPAAPSPSISLGGGRLAVLFDAEPVVAIANLETGKVDALYRLAVCDDADEERDAKELGAAEASAAPADKADKSDKSDKSDE